MTQKYINNLVIKKTLNRFFRAGDKSSPVLDMFQILNLTKRVDGTETGLNKLASMVEDLARERPGTTSITTQKLLQ